jgi:hypothetical protein
MMPRTMSRSLTLMVALLARAHHQVSEVAVYWSARELGGHVPQAGRDGHEVTVVKLMIG